MDQYKSTDTNLATVHKQREERLEQKHTSLALDLERNQNEVQHLTNRVNDLQRELNEKSETIVRLQQQNDSLEGVSFKVRKAEGLIAGNEHMKQDILKLKLDKDTKEKEIQKLKNDIQPLRIEVAELKTKLREKQEKCEHFENEMKKQTKELLAKNENLAIAKFHLDAERRRVKELEHRLEESEQSVDDNRNAQPTSINVETSRMRAEVLRIHQQHLESRVKILEEKVAMYRVQCRNISQEITAISDEITKTNSLKERLVVHGTTQVEKTLAEVLESMQDRKSSLENILSGLLHQIPSIITKDSAAVKADTTSVKKQAELNKISEVVLKSTRLLQRIEACEKAKFLHTNMNVPNGKSVQNGIPVHNGVVHTRPKTRETNLALTIAARAAKQEMSHDVTDAADDIVVNEKCFTHVKPRTANGPLLARPKQPNGPVVAPTWRRKHSFSMEFSPALIDLTLSPASSPSPREKSKTFFSSPSTQSLPSGVRKSISDQGDR